MKKTWKTPSGFISRSLCSNWVKGSLGILLCTQKNDTLVRMTLPEDNKTILASEYKLYLPTSEQLIKEVDTVKKLAKGKKNKKKK